jgi:hypothetical protein
MDQPRRTLLIGLALDLTEEAFMLFALVVMAGVLLLTIVVNNRRTPSRWDRGRGNGGGTEGSTWAYGGDGGDSGADCSTDGGGGGCDGGGGGGGGGGGD